MSLLTRGVSKLSQIGIDIDKDWNGKGISNIKELALGMIQGDLIVKGPEGVLSRLPPGVANTVLTSNGGGAVPSWQPGGTYYNRYYPATAYLLPPSLTKISLAKSAGLMEHPGTVFKHAHIDDEPDYIKRFTPVITFAKSLAVKSNIDHVVSKTPHIGTDLSILIDGFVEETAAGVQTDHTALAKSGTLNDISLCPMTGAQDDRVYIGSNFKFYRVWMQYDTTGVGNWTNVCYYWDGAAWVACVDANDETSSFTAAPGIYKMDHTPQAGWALKTIQGKDLYWMMVSTDNFVNQVVKPLGTQIFVSIA